MRKNFFHFLVYRIELSLEGESTLTDEIYMRYRLLKIILNNAQKMKEEREKVLLNMTHDQHYYKVLKRKLFDKKRKKILKEERNISSPTKYRVSELSKVPMHRSLSDAYSVTPLSHRDPPASTTSTGRKVILPTRCRTNPKT